MELVAIRFSGCLRDGHLSIFKGRPLCYCPWKLSQAFERPHRDSAYPLTRGQGRLQAQYPPNVRSPLHHEDSGHQVRRLFATRVTTIFVQGRHCRYSLKGNCSSSVPGSSSRRSNTRFALVAAF